jgi:hypothetical protein
MGLNYSCAKVVMMSNESHTDVKGEEKKEVQPLLQKAYSKNGEGFYVHAPKQKGNVKEQLQYIAGYIRRPAIALGRIEEYGGEYVTFKYVDKTNGKEKRETLSVEAFIGRLVPHIPMNILKQFVIIGYIHVASNVKAKKKSAYFNKPVVVKS